MPKAVLEGLKKYPVKITAISAMLDSGGFAGKERRLFKTGVAFGDIRRAALAMSEAPKDKKGLFASRFAKGAVLANSYCTSITSSFGLEDLSESLKEDLNIPEGREILPATLDNAQLCAQLENGQFVTGETNIDVPKHDANLRIKKVFLEPEARAFEPAVRAIQEADLIVMGPGDLYSSLAQILLVKGISEAIRHSRASKIYVCNLMTKRGETDNFSVVHFAFEIERYMKGPLDYIIFNKKEISPQRLSAHKKRHPENAALVKFYKISGGKRFIAADVAAENGPIAHDSDKLAKVILSLCPTSIKQ